MQRATLLFLALLFGAFAVVNLNDPDPWAWVLAYGIVSATAVAALSGRWFPRLYLGLAVFFLVIALTMVPDVIAWGRSGMPSIATEMKATEPHIEWMREFLGLLIASLGTVALWRMAPRER